jgi:squalene-associated FAD-dependent desaturase
VRSYYHRVTESRDQQHVVVVGGGLAGLAATVWLAELGYAVTLVESNGSLGGRTIGLTSGHGDAIENGQHVLAGSYENIFRFLVSIGTRHLVEFPNEFGVRYPDGHFETFGFRVRNVRRLLLGQVKGLGIPTLLRAAPAWARLLRDVATFDDALDDITVDEWFDRLGFPAEVRRITLHPMVIGLLNEQPRLASAHALAALLRTGADRARRFGKQAVRIGYPTVDLETLYLDGARTVMAERGVDVRLRTRAASVAVEHGRASGVRLADGSLIDADAVVLAVPSWNLRSLLRDVPGSEDTGLAAKRLEPIPIMNAYVLLDGPLGTAAPWETLLDSDIGWVFDRDRMHGPRDDGNHLYALTTCAAYDLMGLKNAEVADRLVAALRASYPAARDARVLDITVVPWPKATFSSRVGMSTIRPGNRTALPNLALAGDWTHNDWPTTMEGAAQSAARAVDLIHEALTARVSSAERPPVLSGSPPPG